MRRLIGAIGRRAADEAKRGVKIVGISLRKKVTPLTVLARAKRMIGEKTKNALIEKDAKTMWGRIQKLEAEERYLVRMLELLKHEFGGEHEYTLMKEEKTRAMFEALRLRRQLTALREKQKKRKTTQK